MIFYLLLNHHMAAFESKFAVLAGWCSMTVRGGASQSRARPACTRGCSTRRNRRKRRRRHHVDVLPTTHPATVAPPPPLLLALPIPPLDRLSGFAGAPAPLRVALKTCALGRRPCNELLAAELVVLRRLEHPNVVRAHGVVELVPGRQSWLVTDLWCWTIDAVVRGQVATVAFDAGDGLRAARDMARGLNHAHSRRILHRDLRSARAPPAAAARASGDIASASPISGSASTSRPRVARSRPGIRTAAAVTRWQRLWARRPMAPQLTGRFVRWRRSCSGGPNLCRGRRPRISGASG